MYHFPMKKKHIGVKSLNIFIATSKTIDKNANISGLSFNIYDIYLWREMFN